MKCHFCAVVLLSSIACFFQDVHADIIESPENQAVFTNTTAIMKCKTNSFTKPLIWAGVDHASRLVSIYDGERINPAYQELCSVTPNAGRYDLHVKATPQLALLFRCIEPGAENIERKAELIVIESDPKCVISTNSEHIDIACSLMIFGNWIPSMTWRVNGIPEPLNVMKRTQRLDGQRVGVTSTLKNVLQKDKQKYKCDTSFALELYEGDATARNVPAYSYTYMLSPGQASNDIALDDTAQDLEISKEIYQNASECEGLKNLPISNDVEYQQLTENAARSNQTYETLANNESQYEQLG